MYNHIYTFPSSIDANNKFHFRQTKIQHINVGNNKQLNYHPSIIQQKRFQQNRSIQNEFNEYTKEDVSFNHSYPGNKDNVINIDNDGELCHQNNNFINQQVMQNELPNYDLKKEPHIYTNTMNTVIIKNIHIYIYICKKNYKNTLYSNKFIRKIHLKKYLVIIIYYFIYSRYTRMNI